MVLLDSFIRGILGNMKNSRGKRKEEMSFSLIWEGKKLGKKNGDERVFPPCQQMFSLQNEEKIWGKN